MKVLLSKEDLHDGVTRMADEIAACYENRQLTIVGVLTGSVVLMADLIRLIDLPMRVGVLQASSYRGATTTRGELVINSELMLDISGRDVLLVDDIFDTGHTLVRTLEKMREFEPTSIRSAVLLRKHGRQEVDYQPDFVAFDIPDEFVVGYGLDYEDMYRNLPYLAALEPDDIARHKEVMAAQSSVAVSLRETTCSRGASRTTLALRSGRAAARSSVASWPSLGLERVDHHDRQVRIELGQELPASAARRNAAAADDGDCRELALAGGHGRRRRHALGADRQAERSVLDVDALDRCGRSRSAARRRRENSSTGRTRAVWASSADWISSSRSASFMVGVRDQRSWLYVTRFVPRSAAAARSDRRRS